MLCVVIVIVMNACRNLEVATAHVTKMTANLGGTNILKPLEEVLRAKTKEGYPRQLFILTDGEVDNTNACVAFVRKHADTTRVFTFGVGNDASQELVKGLAKAGVRCPYSLASSFSSSYSWLTHDTTFNHAGGLL
jgi:uncharacterized protein YegL